MNLSKHDTQPRVSKIPYVLAGVSFMPLIGIPFGVLAIIFGAIQKTKGPIILGASGILLTILLYGSLFYFGFVAKYGPYYEMKKQVTVQMLSETRGQILIYKEKNKKLPSKLQDLGPETQGNFYTTSDAWMQPIIYKPNSEGTFELRSIGPDGIAYTSDDVISQ